MLKNESIDVIYVQPRNVQKLEVMEIKLVYLSSLQLPGTDI